jgi:phage regulator Rha-like protein
MSKKLAINLVAMTSIEIAEMTGKELTNVHRDIKNMLEQLYKKDDSDLNDIVIQGVASKKDKRGYVKEYSLDESHTMTLITGYSSKLRKLVVDRLRELEKELEIAHKTRRELRVEYRPMTDALKNERTAQGKETKFFHYTNENDLIYRIAFGAPAKQLKEVLPPGELRDVLTPLQRQCVLALQRANTVFIEEGLSYEERKERLTKLFKRKFENLIYEEHVLTAA